MNRWTSYTVICVTLILLIGFVFYLTGSIWTFAILLWLPVQGAILEIEGYEDDTETETNN